MTADSLALEARALERATRKAPGDFHRLVWSNGLRPWVRNRLAGPANAQVLAAYFDLHGEKGLAGGEYRFVFDDEGGRRVLSARASSHWECTPFASLPKATRGRVMKVARGECACELCASLRVSGRAEPAKKR